MLSAQFAFSIVNSPIVVVIARCFVTGSVQVLIPINYRLENALVFLQNYSSLLLYVKDCFSFSMNIFYVLLHCIEGNAQFSCNFLKGVLTPTK